MRPGRSHRHALFAIAAFAAAIATATMPSLAAVGDSGVTASVPSATRVDTSACAPGVAGTTSLGPLPAGVGAYTSADCTITFGSSNGVASLRVRQSDGLGSAMWQQGDGTLDPAFGTGGVVMTDASGGDVDEANASAMQDDGLVLVAGFCNMVGPGTGEDICVARYEEDGDLDPTFGTGGVAIQDVGPGVISDNATSILVQPGVGIVVAGICGTGVASTSDLCLLRFETDGDLDPTFGTAGITITDLSGVDDSDTGTARIAQLPDGRIVAGATCDRGGGDGLDFCFARYSADGVLDAAFGASGVLAMDPSASLSDTMGDLAIDPLGRILAVGSCAGGAGGIDTCIVRIGIDGTPDGTFGSSGEVVHAIAPGVGAEQPAALAITRDGSILAMGSCTLAVTGSDLCMARFSDVGVHDGSFGTSGRVTYSALPISAPDFGAALLVQGDGRIVMGGNCYLAPATDADACTVRFEADGTLDTSYGTGGARIVDSGVPGYDNLYSLTELDDGRVLSAGTCGYDLCTMRFAAGGGAGIDQYVDPTSDWDSVGTTLFAMCLHSINAATADWVQDATCDDTDGPHWNPAPASVPSAVATSDPNTLTASVGLRFGVRTATSQRPGAYVAPLTFDVLGL